MHVSQSDPRIGAVASALERFEWRRFSPELVAGHILAALDRQWLEDELASVCDLSIADCPLEATGLDDERVSVVAHGLRGCRWRSLTSAGVARQALRELLGGEISAGGSTSSLPGGSTRAPELRNL